ncbi:MAG: rhodanese-like domain-containing protein [Thermoanaerobaculia bacterium]|nr:rhodanese-like domain-containing protein [Thermoanaerobaculia bacterium]
MKREILRSAAIIGLAVVLALVTNAFASRQRKLVLPGFYPNALRVPAKAVEKPPASVVTATQPPTPPTIPTTTSTVSVGAGAPARPTAAPPQIPAARPIAKPAAAVAEDPLKKFPPHPDKPYVELSGDDAAWLHARGALFLDARRTSVHEQGHIAGSRPFSVWESDIDDKVNKLFEERGDPRKQLQPIVIYCSGGDCEDSHMLAQKLWGVQFNSVYVYKDGFPDWQKRNGAVKTGSAQ